MRYPSNSGVLWKVVFAFLDIIDTEQTAQIRWNTTGLRCLCLQFHSSRIPTVGHLSSVTMYNPVPIFLTDPAWQSRISPTVPMLSATGRPHESAGCGGFPWGLRRGRGRPFMSSRCKKILQTIRKAFNINGSGLSGRCYDAPTRFR